MAKIIIKSNGKTPDSTRERLAHAIGLAEGRATARTINVPQIIAALAAVDERLDMVSTKADAIGTTVRFDVNGQTFPRAYKYTPESTWVSAVKVSGGWEITDIFRDTTASDSTACRITYTAATISHMADRLNTISAYRLR